jgi:SagB-type dehydrogenase family enzyme
MLSIVDVSAPVRPETRKFHSARRAGKRILLFLFLISGCNLKTEPLQPKVLKPRMVCPVSDRCDRLFCEQVLIPGGSFLMGSDEEPRGEPPTYFGGLNRLGDHSPAHTRELEPFCIDKYEVTVERYEACVQDGFCDPGSSAARTAKDPQSFQTHVNHFPNYCLDNGDRCPTCPVNCRSYENAQQYCAWIGRRLCTEAEWERAASGPGSTKRPYPWGFAAIEPSRANVWGVGPGYVLPVDSHSAGASIEGVFNLAGNVFEWVKDPYREYLDLREDAFDATVGGDLLVARGGCFHIDTGYSSWERTTFHPDFDWGCVGIRCCAFPVAEDGSPSRPRTLRTYLPPLGRNRECTDFRRLLTARQSTRAFSDEALTLNDASHLLWAGQGITRPDGGRTAPSAGALYPLELLLVVSRIEGLDAGVYRYECKEHAVYLLSSGVRSASLSRAALAQESLAEAAAVIVILGVNERSTPKYGDRAERYILLEAGHAAQNILLQAAALDLGAVPIGAFEDESVKQILETAAVPIYLIPVGRKRI